jgi:hypothetical protein
MGSLYSTSPLPVSAAEMKEIEGGTWGKTAVCAENM